MEVALGIWVNGALIEIPPHIADATNAVGDARNFGRATAGRHAASIGAGESRSHSGTAEIAAAGFVGWTFFSGIISINQRFTI